MAVTRSFTNVCGELDSRRHVTLGLERIQELLALLGHPEESLKTVQVVGTNGKGTTSVALAAALEEVGESTGTYLSPHVLSYTERMMVRGQYVSERQFVSVMDCVMDAADAGGVPASQFELLTAGALEVFRREGVGWAILEAGLGARYDATTAAGPEAVVLTSVSLDHTEYLGDTLDEISREKLASLPRGGVLVLGDENPEVVGIARQECKRAGAQLVEVTPPVDETRVGHLAPYALQNVHLGVRAAEVLLDMSLGAEVRGRVQRRVVGSLPGRFEVHALDGVPVVVDGGHNPAGLKTALAAVRQSYDDRPIGVVFGVLRDKDIGSMLTALEKESDHLVITRPSNERAMDPDRLVDQYGLRNRWEQKVGIVADANEALDRVAEEMKQINGVVLVTGSLYTGAPVLERLRAS